MKKKLTMTLFSLALLACYLPAEAAMNLQEVRQNARFLSDRMAYELNLNPNQYGDVYEINYDFLSGIRLVMDGVVRGNEYSIDRYYEYLDMRNEDLSYVLSRRQYLEFADKEYFYRPVYTDRNRWQLRVFTVYANPSFFYFSIPVNFYTYNGIHNRSHYGRGYYNGRYHHEQYHGPLCRIRDHQRYNEHRWHDFNVSPRPDRRPSRYEPTRPGRYERPDRNERPNGNYRPNQGNRPNGNSRPDSQVRPNGNERPNGNYRPNQGNRPNGNSRPDSQVRPNGNERPNGNYRPNQENRPNENSRPNSQVRPNGNERPNRVGQVNHQADRDKSGTASSERPARRHQTGGSRR